jgi:hypothetical protein
VTKCLNVVAGRAYEWHNGFPNSCFRADAPTARDVDDALQWVHPCYRIDIVERWISAMNMAFHKVAPVDVSHGFLVCKAGWRCNGATAFVIPVLNPHLMIWPSTSGNAFGRVNIEVIRALAPSTTSCFGGWLGFPHMQCVRTQTQHQQLVYCVGSWLLALPDAAEH